MVEPTDLEAVDKKVMWEVLTLAAESGSTSFPGPMDACFVATAAGAVYKGAGEDAYEAALRQAGADARGATAYVVQEPSVLMAGTGRSAVDAILRSGIARLVGAEDTLDATQAGTGYEALRSAGIDVSTGVLAPEARNLNRAYLQWRATGLPYITALIRFNDAAPSTSAASTNSVYLRHVHDAILTDAATAALAPNNLFTDSSGQPRSRKFMRLLYDSTLSVDPGSALIASWDNDLILLTSTADLDRIDAVRGVGIAVETLGPDPTAAAWKALLITLGELPIQKLLVEASDFTAMSLVTAGLVSEVVTVAPDGFIPARWKPVLKDRPTSVPTTSEQDGQLITSYHLGSS